MQIVPIKRKHFIKLMLGALPSVAGLSTCAMRSMSTTADPIGVSLKQNGYQQAAEYSEANNGLAMVVVQSGQIIFESYAPRASIEQGNELSERGLPLASGTKSFSCAIALLGMQDGLLTLDEPVANTITEWKRYPRRSRITIRQLLTLTSGITGGNISSIPSYRDAIAERLTAEPGESYQYGPVPFQIFGKVMRRKLASHGMMENPVTYLDSRLFQPIGLTYNRWLEGPDGYPNLPSGAIMSARQWAKYGLLLLNGGQWQGQQVLDSDQLNQCFQGTAANPAYGLTFWLNKDGFTHSGEPLEKISTVSDSMVMAIGTGDQVMFVLPEHDLVVVRQGRLNQQDSLETDGFNREIFLNLILTEVN